MNVIEYVTEEVNRQGHNVQGLDGIERVAWMLAAWRTAILWARTGETIDIDDVRVLGTMVEPEKNEYGFRTCGVRVGNRVCPPAADVPILLDKLFDRLPHLSPLDFYREFETIHPFVDGNGRTGKIILNTLNGTLLKPIFPPNNFWGEPIRNP